MRIDASEVTAISGSFNQITALYGYNVDADSYGFTGLGNENITSTEDLTVAAANVFDNLTKGTVTAEIDPTETVDSLVNLTGTNAYTIKIASEDATGNTAAEFNTINTATTVAIDVSAVTALASSSLADLQTLGTAIANSEFSNATGVTTIAISDTTVDATVLAASIDSIDSLNGQNTTLMTLPSGATINVDAGEVTHMLLDETENRLDIVDQNIVVTGNISVDDANLLSETTTGTVTASIATTESITELKTLTETNNAYTIVISSSDATATAEDLLAIDAKTTVRIDASEVTAISGSFNQIEELYGSEGVTGLGNENITSTEDLTVAAASVFDALTEGTVTAATISSDTDALAYIASHKDLLNSFNFSNNYLTRESKVSAAIQHYNDYGNREGRSLNAFDSWDYLASHKDLINAYGTDTAGATDHYIEFGYLEGRECVFDKWSYLASYTDLIEAYGTDTHGATQHYVAYGFNEGRSADTFDEWNYLASHTDLIEAYGTDVVGVVQHYVAHGFNEGRSADTFDELTYLASNTDLIEAYGLDLVGVVQHYVAHGFNEGRSVNSFDASKYIAQYSDIKAAYGTDLRGATEHYIVFGFDEGRTLHLG